MDRLNQIFTFLRQYVADHGFAPTQREIADAVGLKSASDIKRHLEQLEEAGLIERGKGKARAIRINGVEH